MQARFLPSRNYSAETNRSCERVLLWRTTCARVMETSRQKEIQMKRSSHAARMRLLRRMNEVNNRKTVWKKNEYSHARLQVRQVAVSHQKSVTVATHFQHPFPTCRTAIGQRSMRSPNTAQILRKPPPRDTCPSRCVALLCSTAELVAELTHRWQPCFNYRSQFCTCNLCLPRSHDRSSPLATSVRRHFMISAHASAPHSFSAHCAILFVISSPRDNLPLPAL